MQTIAVRQDTEISKGKNEQLGIFIHSDSLSNIIFLSSFFLKLTFNLAFLLISLYSFPLFFLHFCLLSLCCLLPLSHLIYLFSSRVPILFVSDFYNCCLFFLFPSRIFLLFYLFHKFSLSHSSFTLFSLGSLRFLATCSLSCSRIFARREGYEGSSGGLPYVST